MDLGKYGPAMAWTQSRCSLTWIVCCGQSALGEWVFEVETVVCKAGIAWYPDSRQLMNELEGRMLHLLRSKVEYTRKGSSAYYECMCDDYERHTYLYLE